MSKTITRVKELAESVRQNREEVFASLAIFIGLPVVAWLYFDYRASLAVFVLAVGTVSVLAMRGK